MGSAGFDSARWDHWLLIACFLAIATYGLWSSWQWRKAARQQQAKAQLARRLAMEIHPSYLQPTASFYASANRDAGYNRASGQNQQR